MRQKPLITLAFTTGLTAVLSGCLLGPSYERPESGAPAQFRFSENNALIADTVNTAWWEQFQDPVLTELIHTALAENRDVKIAAARVEEFMGLLGVTRSQFFPQVGADYEASNNRASTRSPLTAPGGDPPYKQYSGGLSASWEIDFFGRIKRETEAARADLLASEEARRSTALTLVASVATSYINLRSLDQQLAIAKNTAQSRSDSVDLFTAQFKGGVVSELELAQAKSEYESSLATIPQIESQIAVQENALSVLLGRNPGPILRGRELAQLEAPAVPAGLPSALLEQRPDLRAAEQNLIAANALIGAAKALYFPTISLTGTLGSLSTESKDLFSGPARTWSYAGVVSLPIFTGGNISGQVKQAEARQQQALFSYQQAIQNAFRDSEDALVTLQKTRDSLAAQQRQVDALRTYARLARLRYDGGYSNYLEVLDAERSLFNAELNYTQSQESVLASVVNVYRAFGGGWADQAAAYAEQASLATMISATLESEAPAETAPVNTTPPPAE